MRYSVHRLKQKILEMRKPIPEMRSRLAGRAVEVVGRRRTWFEGYLLALGYVQVPIGPRVIPGPTGCQRWHQTGRRTYKVEELVILV
jgi:hypothetical protein